MDFQLLLRFAVENDASDIHIQAGLRPCLRIGGILHMTDQPPMADAEVRAFIASIAPPRMQDNFDDRLAGGWISHTRSRGRFAIAARATGTSAARASRCG
jgi:twitching motility protein PilT